MKTEEDILREKIYWILQEFEQQGVMYIAFNKLLDLFNSELEKAKKEWKIKRSAKQQVRDNLNY